MDNALEPEEAMYPNVPAEVPGVVLEAHVPAVSTPPTPTREDIMETRAGLAAENTDFGPRILEINNGGIAGARQLVNTGPQIVNNYIHIVPDDGPNNVPHNDMDELQELSEEDDDSSNDGTYVDETLDEEESLYYDGEEENGKDDDNIEEMRTS